MKTARHFQILMTLLLCIMGVHHLYGRIHQKVDEDGTVIYYNTSPETSQSDTKISLSTKYDDLIYEISGRNDIDPYLIKCIIQVESSFNPDAMSVAGAKGLMQLMPGTYEYYDVTDPFDPRENLEAGIKHFKGLMKYFDNDVPLSLAAYHAGLGRVKKKMAIPPIKSTIAYVNKVMKLYNGTSDHSPEVKKLYQKVDSEGTLIIYSK